MPQNEHLTFSISFFAGPETGRLLTDTVLRAADRGVRVRVLIDDGETTAGDDQITKLAAHHLVEIRIAVTSPKFLYQRN